MVKGSFLVSILLVALAPVVARAAWPHLALPTLDHYSILASAGRSQSNWHGTADAMTLALELTHAFSPRTELGLAVQGFTFVQPRSWFGYSRHEDQETVRGIAASLQLRRWLYAESDRARPYLELATGPMTSGRRVPAATSRFNVVSQAGIGVMLRANQPLPILLGYRFSHISNGGYADRNPGLNVHSFVIGFRGDFKRR
jgi:hypothetical protein